MELKQERETNQELMEMIDSTREQGKIIEVNDNSKEESYVGYASYLYNTEKEGEVYLLFVPENFPNSARLCTKEWLHDTMLNQDTADLIEIEEADDEVVSTLERWDGYGNPREEIHVIVKTTDDGRYKDDYKFVREGTEKSKGKYLGGLNDPESRFEYIDLGSFKEVVEGDEVYDFDLKQSGRGVPIDFTTLTTSEERQLMRDKISGDVKESNGDEE